MVSLRPLTDANRRDVLALRVAPSQQGFVSSVADSLREAAEHPDAHALYWAIYADDTPVGFVMIADEVAGADYIPHYLWKLLIDERHQRQGYGSATLDLVVEYFRGRPGAEVLTTSAGQGDGSPIEFYERYGFERTGAVHGGEVVLQLRLHPTIASQHTERSTLAACIAHIAGAPASDVPLDPDEQHGWLAERGLGLVPLADAASFGWPGPWIARRPARDGSGPRAVVMFGVPSGVLWDPADTAEEILGGYLVGAHDLATWSPRAAADAGIGRVEALVVAPAAEAPAVRVDEAVALPGRGVDGDRYAAGSGTFTSGRPGSALTLVDADVLDTLGRDVDHRRNVVVRGTDLNALVGRDFMLGEVRCRGRRLCEPCAHLDRLNGGGILRPLVHRGGLRADILSEGTIRVGDALTPV